jgi:cell division FtsZ-interacting protein ZapD
MKSTLFLTLIASTVLLHSAKATSALKSNLKLKDIVERKDLEKELLKSEKEKRHRELFKRYG